MNVTKATPTIFSQIIPIKEVRLEAYLYRQLYWQLGLVKKLVLKGIYSKESLQSHAEKKLVKQVLQHTI